MAQYNRTTMRTVPNAFFSVLATAGMLSLAQAAAAQEAVRHVESAGGFSFVAPPAWVFRDMPGLKYAIAFGPAGPTFNPNINVVDETFTGSVEDYARANLQTMKSVLKNFKVIGPSGFATDSGIPGAWLTAEDDSNGNRLRQTFFFFGNGDRKYVVTCTTLAEGGTKYDALFKSALKSFRFEH